MVAKPWIATGLTALAMTGRFMALAMTMLGDNVRTFLRRYALVNQKANSQTVLPVKTAA